MGKENTQAFCGLLHSGYEPKKPLFLTNAYRSHIRDGFWLLFILTVDLLDLSCSNFPSPRMYGKNICTY